MDYFKKYSSNTYAGSGNQLFFENEGVHTGRLFYKISVGGKYNYSILFSNIIDSTYSDGQLSHANLVCDSWKIISARIGKCIKIDEATYTCREEVYPIVIMNETDDANIKVFDFKDVTFDGKTEKTVNPSEFFNTDPTLCDFKKGEYLCLEVTFSGDMIPYHEESIIPTYTKLGDNWIYSRKMPFASMVGCDRPVKSRIAFLGDSITQGIGTQINSYKHWNALVSEMSGEEYSFWNLGLGYGRAEDAATDGAWLFRAKQADKVAICFGVNDLVQLRNPKKLKEDLKIIIEKLSKDVKKIYLQTIPPFGYDEEATKMWNEVNTYIKCELSKKDNVVVFDNNPILGRDKEHLQMTKYGGHPNEEGCEKWANAMRESFLEFIK